MRLVKGNNMVDAIIQDLCSSLKLERDKGFQNFVKHIDLAESEDIDTLEQCITKILTEEGSSWEKKHGGLMAAKALLISGKSSDDFAVDMRSQALKYLEDNEFRVRIAAGIYDVVFNMYVIDVQIYAVYLSFSARPKQRP